MILIYIILKNKHPFDPNRKNQREKAVSVGDCIEVKGLHVATFKGEKSCALAKIGLFKYLKTLRRIKQHKKGF
jgi:hypothetical protein